MNMQRKLPSMLLAGLALSCAIAAAFPAQAQTGAGDPQVLTYPPYQRSVDSGDPFGATCEAQYATQIRQINADHQAGGRACFFRGNGACHAANNSNKAARQQAAAAQRRQCRQAGAQRQSQAAQQRPSAQQARPLPERTDQEAINQAIQRQINQAQQEYARGLAEAKARAQAEARAAAAARRAEEARRFADANRFIDVLTGRRVPVLP